MHTQPLDVQTSRIEPAETRRFRLLRTTVFALAIVIGIATVVRLATEDGSSSLPNSSGIFSPSGHLPSEPSDDQKVSISWTAVKGAAGYWWAMVDDPARLPRPVIRPSGDDRRVFFRFSGRGYFVLRTAFRIEGRLRWSEKLLYGPIIVRDRALQGAELVPSPGSTAVPGRVGDGTDASGQDATGLSGSGGAGAPRATTDPRFAGEAGTCGTSGGSCGGAGQPGQPAQEPGGGNCTDCPGTDGPQGQDGPPG